MSEKYYTPELEEFCITFLYEYYTGTNWELMSFSWDIPYDEMNPFKGAKVRVRYLDQSDIEECGFKNIPWHHKQFKKYCYETDNDNIWYLVWVFRDKYITIEKVEVNKQLTYMITKLFRGIIKNKTEFKKVLKMLGI